MNLKQTVLRAHFCFVIEQYDSVKIRFELNSYSVKQTKHENTFNTPKFHSLGDPAVTPLETHRSSLANTAMVTANFVYLKTQPTLHFDFERFIVD